MSQLLPLPAVHKYGEHFLTPKRRRNAELIGLGLRAGVFLPDAFSLAQYRNEEITRAAQHGELKLEALVAEAAGERSAR
jgi:hypothetical protein